jgi:hypothetical protein
MLQITVHQIELSAKMALGKFTLSQLANDSLPKIVITGLAYCYGGTIQEIAPVMGFTRAEYKKAMTLFRNAPVACIRRRATAHQQQIVEATREVDKTIRAMYLPKQYVEL